MGQIDKINDDNYESLINLINRTNDLNAINVIIRLLNKAYCFGDEINNEIVKKQIQKKLKLTRCCLII